MPRAPLRVTIFAKFSAAAGEIHARILFGRQPVNYPQNFCDRQPPFGKSPAKFLPAKSLPAKSYTIVLM
jgi:hypothetical protein